MAAEILELAAEYPTAHETVIVQARSLKPVIDDAISKIPAPSHSVAQERHSDNAESTIISETIEFLVRSDDEPRTNTH